MSYRADALGIDNAAYGEGVASVVTAVNVKNTHNIGIENDLTPKILGSMVSGDADGHR